VVVQQGVRELLVDMGSPLFGPPRWAPRSYYLYSDAAAEDSGGGLGGSHGDW
jgi:hypothetical protein